MQTLNIRLIQTALFWENSSKNLGHLSKLMLGGIPEEIVVLPEMFATGFTMHPELYAQTMDGETVTWMREKSMHRVVCGSLSIKENGKYYNRFIWCENGEIVAQYDKKHLFTYGNEHSHYTAGNKHVIIEYKGWKIQPFICYDIRFPVWNRNTHEAHIQLYVANWPERRIYAWETLLKARAIENQCYTIGVNRVGKDGHGVPHNGNSAVYDFMGQTVEHGENHELAMFVSLEPQPLVDFRAQFPFLKDKDSFNLL
jgi:omega-amidase